MENKIQDNQDKENNKPNTRSSGTKSSIIKNLDTNKTKETSKKEPETKPNENKPNIIKETEPKEDFGNKYAGGANTNLYGKAFEAKTDNYARLIESGYKTNNFSKKSKKNADYLSNNMEDKTIIFTSQNGLKLYMKNKYDIELFRNPDEAYIIEYNTGKKIIKILEKKSQNVEGSAETKLWSSPSLKREYELVLGNQFEVQYGLCVSDFFKKKLTSTEKKYTILNTILKENNIPLLFGSDKDYFKNLDEWIIVS